MKAKRIKQSLACAIIVLFLYVIFTGVLPYVYRKEVSQDFKDSIKTADFYGNEEKPSVDRVALVEAPDESLATRIHILYEAEKTLDISYYAIHMGESTDRFLGAILDAANRGVKVRLLLDGISNGFGGSHKHLGAALGSHPNIECRLYNKINYFKPWTYNGRLHDKYIIVDNKLLLLGGRNIGDKYFAPESFAKALSIDRDVLIYNTAYGNEENQNSVLFRVREYMERVWCGFHTKTVFEKATKKSLIEAERIKAMMQNVNEQYSSLFYENLDYQSITVPTSKVSLICNDIQITKKAPKVGYVLEKLLTSAKNKVILQSPYVVLDKNLTRFLTRLGKMDIDYSILTNSSASTPNLPAFSAYMRDRKKIAAMGARIYEFQDKNAIHAKTYIVDDRLSLVGSYNLDPRSAYIDTELMLVIDSKAFTKNLTKVIDGYKENSLVVGKDGSYLPSDMVTAVDVSGMKKTIIAVVGVFVPCIRFLV